MFIPFISGFFGVSSRGFLLAHSFTGSTATSRAGSLGIGVNGTHPSGAKCFINPAVRNTVRAYKFNSQPSTIKTAQTTPTNLNNRNSPQYQYYS
jgi:hypothetical protein